MDLTPRAQRTTPNKHDEKNFVNSLLKTCNQYYLHNLKPIWLRKNVNGTYRPMGKEIPVRVGLGTGVGDCVGYTMRVITPGMVGKRVAIYTEVEAKLSEGGVISTAQREHSDQVRRDGGIAIFAYDTDGVQNTLDKLEQVSFGASSPVTSMTSTNLLSGKATSDHVANLPDVESDE